MNRSAASKPTGVWDVRRKIKIPALVHEADAMMVEGRVGSLPGVRSVAADVQKHQLTVCYDVTGSDYQSIIELLENTGFPPLNNWLTRRKKSWYQYTETTARENAKAPPPACCNKPPK